MSAFDALLPSLQQTLQSQGITTPTPIQDLVLPRLLDRDSVVAVAETGSGKTLAYALPLLDRLKRLEDAGNPVPLPAEPRALVLAPTRELGEQIARVFKSFTHDTRLRVRFALGGQRLRRIRDNVAGEFEILVATPGRLQKLVDRDSLSLAGIRYVILDEADQLLDLSFLRQILSILSEIPGHRQLGLFSATLPPLLQEITDDLFTEAVLLQTEGAAQRVPTLTTRRVDVPDGRRFDRLPALLREPVEGGTMLFANTREQADRIAEVLSKEGFVSAVIRGDMPRGIRRRELRAFRSGTVPLLVATDAAGRGLDIEHVGRVINVYLPRQRDNYLHRCGRTARAGRTGTVIDLVTPRDVDRLAEWDAAEGVDPGTDA